MTQQQLISMTRRKRERWWTLSLQTVPKWSNVWLMMLKNFIGLKLAPPLFWETSFARSCHKCDSYISCTTNPQPPTIYGEGRDGHFASPPRWCEICGRSFGISHENQSVCPRENYSGLYPNRSKKDTCAFFS